MQKTKLMGILNVTPDSCFCQGRHFESTRAIQHGIDIATNGADWIDIGGESTQPGALGVNEAEELRRVIPVIQELKQKVSIPLSIDTMKARVAEKALEAGVLMINDVSGFEDEGMRRVAVNAQSLICVMHMQGTPQTMQIHPFYPKGIIPTLIDWFQRRTDLLIKEGMDPKQIIIDPGIGFGKTIADNLEIVENLPKIKDLGFPVLIGLSRKSFLGKILNKPYPELLPATLGINALAIQLGADYVRVHDVKEHRDIIDIISCYKTTCKESK